MSTLLFIISAVLFQLPFSTFQDSTRRLRNMEMYNPMNALDYKLENGKLNENIIIILLVFFSAFIGALFPLFKGINAHWLILIIGNIVCLYFVSPFIAFRLYPKGMIYGKKVLLNKTILYIFLGILCYVLASKSK